MFGRMNYRCSSPNHVQAIRGLRNLYVSDSIFAC